MPTPSESEVRPRLGVENRFHGDESTLQDFKPLTDDSSSSSDSDRPEPDSSSERPGAESSQSGRSQFGRPNAEETDPRSERPSSKRLTPEEEALEERAHLEFARQLSPEEKQLVILRDELYEGSWQDMRSDLVDRRDGKPFIYKLVNRIDEDLERIDRLVTYEDTHDINLGEFIDDA